MFVVMGALLIALAALLRFVLVPMVSKLPGDLDVNPVYEGTGTLLNAQALQAGDIANVIASDVPVTIDCHIYVSSTDGDTALAHDDVTLTAPGLSVPSDHTYAIDRKTMDAANSYSGEGVEPHSGMTIALPLHPDPAASYQYYDSATRTTAPMIYVDSGSISGRDILNYTVEAKGALRDPAIARTLPPALPKSLLGIRESMRPARSGGPVEVFSPHRHSGQRRKWSVCLFILAATGTARRTMSEEDRSRNTVRMGSGGKLTWDNGSALDDVDRRRVESWLAALLQSEHLSLLIGNGLSCAIGAMTGTFPPSMTQPISDTPTDVLERARLHAKSTAEFMGRDSNLEDEIRAAMVLADGLAVLGQSGDEQQVREAIESAMARLLAEVLRFEKRVWDEHLNATDKARQMDQSLLRFLGPFVSRPVQRDRLHLFTTNYDRLLEYAADLIGLHLIDRFEGRLHPRFTASRLNLDLHYSPPGVRGEPRLVDGVVRYSKLHGSIDWQFSGREILRAPLPFGGPNSGNGVPTAVIYPNPAKDVETLAYPYAELFRDFAAAICRPNTTLVTFGYGFGDDHINRIIGDMLRIPSTHLVVVSRDPLNALESFKKRTFYPLNQTTELIGPNIGGLAEFSQFLPSLVSDRVLEAQFDYLDRRTKLNGVLQPATNGPSTGGDA